MASPKIHDPLTKLQCWYVMFCQWHFVYASCRLSVQCWLCHYEICDLHVDFISKTTSVIPDTVSMYHRYVCGESVWQNFKICVFSPTSDGSAATILCSEEFVKKHNLQNQAVEIVAMEMGTDFPSTFKENSCMKMVTYYRRIPCHFKVKIKI